MLACVFPLFGCPIVFWRLFAQPARFWSNMATEVWVFWESFPAPSVANRTVFGATPPTVIFEPHLKFWSYKVLLSPFRLFLFALGNAGRKCEQTLLAENASRYC